MTQTLRKSKQKPCQGSFYKSRIIDNEGRFVLTESSLIITLKLSL